MRCQPPTVKAMQLRHFHYFIAVAEAGSFVKAAKRLHISQPSLSTQIHDLEREVGVPLFVRLPTGVRLTPAGAAFLKDAQNTVESAVRAVSVARAAGMHVPAKLRFAYGRAVHITGAVSELLGEFRARHHDADVAVFPMDELEQRHALREHRIDVSAAFTGRLPVEGFASCVFADFVITGVLLPVSHPLTSKKQISLSELGDSPWFHLPRRSSPESMRYLRAALVERGLIIRRHSSRPSDLNAAAVHVAAEGGWILATKALARRFRGQESPLTYRPFVERPIPYWLVLMWRQMDTSPLVQDIVQLAVARAETGESINHRTPEASQ